jgi:hypothetical protein
VYNQTKVDKCPAMDQDQFSSSRLETPPKLASVKNSSSMCVRVLVLQKDRSIEETGTSHRYAVDRQRN